MDQILLLAAASEVSNNLTSSSPSQSSVPCGATSWRWGRHSAHLRLGEGTAEEHLLLKKKKKKVLEGKPSPVAWNPPSRRDLESLKAPVGLPSRASVPVPSQRTAEAVQWRLLWGAKSVPNLAQISDEDDISVLINRQIRGIINCHHEGVSGAHEMSVHTQLFECVIKCLTFWTTLNSHGNPASPAIAGQGDSGKTGTFI